MHRTKQALGIAPHEALFKKKKHTQKSPMLCRCVHSLYIPISVYPYIPICPTRAVSIWCQSEHRQYVHCLWCLANTPAKCARAAMDPTASSLSDSRRDKEESLRRRRERDRIWRASETGAQREERLRLRRERDRTRRAAQSEEQRASVLLRKLRR